MNCELNLSEITHFSTLTEILELQSQISSVTAYGIESYREWVTENLLLGPIYGDQLIGWAERKHPELAEYCDDAIYNVHDNEVYHQMLAEYTIESMLDCIRYALKQLQHNLEDLSADNIQRNMQRIEFYWNILTGQSQIFNK